MEVKIISKHVNEASTWYKLLIDGIEFNYDIVYDDPAHLHTGTYMYIMNGDPFDTLEETCIQAIIELNEANPAETIERIHKLALLL